MQVSLNWVDFIVLSPAVALFVASLFPILFKALTGNKERGTFIAYGFGMVGVVAGLILTAGNWGIQRTVFSGAIVFDSVSAFVSMIILVITGVGLTFLRESPATNRKQFSESVFLLLNSSVGMLIFAWSNDLILTFIGFELLSLCLYVLIAIGEEDRLSKEAAFKYFILGSFASAVMLYGISFIYGSSGTTSLVELGEVGITLASSNRMFFVGLLMFLAGLFFKISIFPFHFWTPDVYQGSPTPVTAYMAAGVKATTVIFLLRVMSLDMFTAEKTFPFVDAMQWICVITILVGNVGALRQRSMKRMLAYSAVGHSGYVLIGLIAAGIGGQTYIGATGVLYYIFAYTLMTLGTFGVLALLEKHSDHDIGIEDMKGLARRKPVIAAAMAIMLFSLAGIPPTVGFFGKFMVISAAVKQQLFWLALWGVLGSVISVYYYLRPIVAMYMEETVLDESEQPSVRPISQFVVSLLALMIVGFGISSEGLFQNFFRSILEIFS